MIVDKEGTCGLKFEAHQSTNITYLLIYRYLELSYPSVHVGSTVTLPHSLEETEKFREMIRSTQVHTPS